MPPQKRNPENDDLPRYWRLRGKTFYYRVPTHLRHLHNGKKEISLGQSKAGAYKKYASLYEVEECITLMRDLLDRYRFEVVPEKAIATQASNNRSLDRLTRAIGGNPVNTVTPKAIYRYRDLCARKHSKTYANRDLEVLSHCFTKAIEWGVIGHHPMTNKQVTKFKLEGRDRYVEDWELDAWWSVASPFLRAYAQLKGATGLRKQDLLTIRRTDVTDTELVSVNLKTKKPQRFPLVDDDGAPTSVGLAIAAVHTYYDGENDLRRRRKRPALLSPWLFHTRTGSCYYDPEKLDPCSGFTSIFKRSMKKALAVTALVEPFTDHDLRTKVGSDLETDDDAARLLNHSTKAVTRKHYRLRGSKMQPAPGFSVSKIAPKK